MSYQTKMILIFLLVLFGIVGNFDYEASLTTKAIVNEQRR